MHVLSPVNLSLVLFFPYMAFLEKDPISVESKHASKSHKNSGAVLTAVYGRVTDSSQVKSVGRGFTAFLLLTVELGSI